MKRIVLLTLAMVVALPAAVSAQSGDSKKQMERAKNRVQSTLPADGAVKADTAKKPSMVGVPKSEFKPQVKVKPSAPPPSPVANTSGGKKTK